MYNYTSLYLAKDICKVEKINISIFCNKREQMCTLYQLISIMKTKEKMKTKVKEISIILFMNRFDKTKLTQILYFSLSTFENIVLKQFSY